MEREQCLTHDLGTRLKLTRWDLLSIFAYCKLSKTEQCKGYKTSDFRNSDPQSTLELVLCLELRLHCPPSPFLPLYKTLHTVLKSFSHCAGEEEAQLKKRRDASYTKCSELKKKLKASREALQQISVLGSSNKQTSDSYDSKKTTAWWDVFLSPLLLGQMISEVGWVGVVFHLSWGPLYHLTFFVLPSSCLLHPTLDTCISHLDDSMWNIALQSSSSPQALSLVSQFKPPEWIKLGYIQFIVQMDAMVISTWGHRYSGVEESFHLDQ